MATLQNTLSIWLFWIIIHAHRETGHKIKEKGYKGHTQTKKKKEENKVKEKMATFQGDMQWSLCTRTVETCWGQGQTRTNSASMRTRQKVFVTKRSFTNKKDNKLKKLKIWRTRKKQKTIETQLTLSKSCLSLQTITGIYESFQLQIQNW